MRANVKTAAAPARRTDIVHLSDRHGVSMIDRYFDLVDLDHFWAIRRYEVMERLASDLLQPGLAHCEIGCGNGILQRQLELKHDLKVDGFELCLPALENNICTRGTLYYYNIFERKPELKGRYDVVYLFDVLEHIEDHAGFLDACFFHLRETGALILNVPARNELFSKYDVLNGHVRRYTLKALREAAGAARLRIRNCTYWGLPLYPVLFLRKLLVRFMADSVAYDKGFTPPGPLANRSLRWLSRLELLPQRVLGTSILAVLRR